MPYEIACPENSIVIVNRLDNTARVLSLRDCRDIKPSDEPILLAAKNIASCTTLVFETKTFVVMIHQASLSFLELYKLADSKLKDEKLLMAYVVDSPQSPEAGRMLLLSLAGVDCSVRAPVFSEEELRRQFDGDYPVRVFGFEKMVAFEKTHTGRYSAVVFDVGSSELAYCAQNRLDLNKSDGYEILASADKPVLEKAVCGAAGAAPIIASPLPILIETNTALQLASDGAGRSHSLFSVRDAAFSFERDIYSGTSFRQALFKRLSGCMMVALQEKDKQSWLFMHIPPCDLSTQKAWYTELRKAHPDFTVGVALVVDTVLKDLAADQVRFNASALRDCFTGIYDLRFVSSERVRGYRDRGGDCPWYALRVNLKTGTVAFVKQPTEEVPEEGWGMLIPKPSVDAGFAAGMRAAFISHPTSLPEKSAGRAAGPAKR